MFGEGTGGANGIARAADGCADVHERLSEIARPAARGQAAGGRRELPPGVCDRLFQSQKPGQDAGDIAIDGRSLAAKCDRRDRSRGIGADARKRAQIGFFTRKRAAPSSNLLGAGVQVPGAEIKPIPAKALITSSIGAAARSSTRGHFARKA